MWVPLVVYQESLKHTSVLDSGAARHVHPDVIITDMENRTKLSSFTGEDVWTDGLGYIPCEFHDDNTSKPFKLDIDDADYVKGITCTLISMGKLIKQGWKFTFELVELIGWTPSGHKVMCTLGDDNVIRIPHGISSSTIKFARVNAGNKVWPATCTQVHSQASRDPKVIMTGLKRDGTLSTVIKVTLENQARTVRCVTCLRA